MDNRARLESPDLLSGLPSGIIHTILSLLPFAEAVRTSVLSKQWRFTWATRPNLKINDYGDNWLLKDSDISHVLCLHNGPVHRFEITLPTGLTYYKLNEWIRFLCSKGIRELVIINTWNKHDCSIPNGLQSIYECSKLTYLELFGVEFCPLPSTFKGFPFLRCLFLQYCDLSDEVQRLLVNSPLLERLTLIHSSDSSKLKINLPYLKYLCLRGFWDEIHLCAPLLTELKAEMEDYDWDDYTPPHYHLSNYTDFEKICGDEFLIQILRTGMESSNHTLVFSRLKEIDLGYLDFEEMKEISVVVRLLNGAPNLQKLSLKARGYGDVNDIIGCEPNFTFEKLKFVTVIGVCRYVFGIRLIKVLLESSPALVTMKIEEFIVENYENLKAEILEFRASPNAQIFLNGSRLAVD